MFAFHTSVVPNSRNTPGAASQRVGILRKSSRVFHDRSLLGRCFRCFVLPVLEYCSACDARLPIDTLIKVSARFLTGEVFECDIAHHRSVAVLCMRVIRAGTCNPMHHLHVVLYLDSMRQCGLHRTSIYLFASSLQNLAVPRTFIPL